MSGSRRYLIIKNHIFKTDAIATVSHFSIDVSPPTYEVLIAYDAGPSIQISYQSKDEAIEAFQKIEKALNAE